MVRLIQPHECNCLSCDGGERAPQGAFGGSHCLCNCHEKKPNPSSLPKWTKDIEPCNGVCDKNQLRLLKALSILSIAIDQLPHEESCHIYEISDDPKAGICDCPKSAPSLITALGEK